MHSAKAGNYPLSTSPKFPEDYRNKSNGIPKSRRITSDFHFYPKIRSVKTLLGLCMAVEFTLILKLF